MGIDYEKTTLKDAFTVDAPTFSFCLDSFQGGKHEWGPFIDEYVLETGDEPVYLLDDINENGLFPLERAKNLIKVLSFMKNEEDTHRCVILLEKTQWEPVLLRMIVAHRDGDKWVPIIDHRLHSHVLAEKMSKI